MPIYRFYHLGKNGKCHRFTDHDCRDDEHAIELARELLSGHGGGIEVFVRKGRRVGRVDPDAVIRAKR